MSEELAGLGCLLIPTSLIEGEEKESRRQMRNVRSGWLALLISGATNK